MHNIYVDSAFKKITHRKYGVCLIVFKIHISDYHPYFGYKAVWIKQMQPSSIQTFLLNIYHQYCDIRCSLLCNFLQGSYMLYITTWT